MEFTVDSSLCSSFRESEGTGKPKLQKASSGTVGSEVAGPMPSGGVQQLLFFFGKLISFQVRLAAQELLVAELKNLGSQVLFQYETLQPSKKINII